MTAELCATGCGRPRHPRGRSGPQSELCTECKGARRREIVRDSVAKHRQRAREERAVKEYGLKLRAVRQGAGLTQAKLSQATGLDQGLLSRYERGLVVPPVAAMQAIDRVLGREVARQEVEPELPDDEVVRRYQLVMRARDGRLWPGEIVPDPSTLRDWRTSSWLKAARQRGVIPPSLKQGGRYGTPPKETTHEDDLQDAQRGAHGQADPGDAAPAGGRARAAGGGGRAARRRSREGT
jgi:transcriptional regulator with XRE-family HTH domain